jgi:hypothetical protein
MLLLDAAELGDVLPGDRETGGIARHFVAKIPEAVNHRTEVDILRAAVISTRDAARTRQAQDAPG